MELSPFSRITWSLQSNTIRLDLARNMQALYDLQRQIASGKRIVVPSMDAVGTNTVLKLEELLGRQAQYVRNIEQNTGMLSMADSALGDVSELVIQARELAIEQANDISSNAETRLAASRQVVELINEVVNIANRKLGQRYVFGGTETQSVPFVLKGDSVLYQGNSGAMEVDIADGTTLQVNITGMEAFGALTAEVGTTMDLDPILSDGSGGDRPTALSELNAGKGVARGAIRISDGITTVDVDLSEAEDIGDVIRIINDQAGALVSAALTGSGITLTAAGGPITVEEVAGGSTAFDLGILQTALQAVIVGGDLNPQLNLLTSLGLLNGGAGIDLSGITITNGTESASISFATAQTVQDVINAINGAGINVEAGVNSAGTGIVIRSRLSGVTMTIDENGGTSAADLGVLETGGVSAESIFTPLLRLKEALISNDQAGIAEQIDALENGLGLVLDARATVGTRVQRLDLSKDRLDNESTQLKSILSATQDLNYADAAVEFTQQQNVMQAALAMAASIMRTSLLDYLT